MLSYIDAKAFVWKTKAKEFLKSERGEVNIVTTVVLIGIAVALALIFKNSITGLIQTLLGSITTNAQNAIK